MKSVTALLSSLLLAGCQIHIVNLEYDIDGPPPPQIMMIPNPHNQPDFSSDMDHGIYRGHETL